MRDREPRSFALIVRNEGTLAGGVFININIPAPITIATTSITKHLTVRDRSVGANFVSYAERINLYVYVYLLWRKSANRFFKFQSESLFNMKRTILMED